MPTSDKRTKADTLVKMMSESAVGDRHPPPDCDVLGAWLCEDQCPPEVLRPVHVLAMQTMQDGVIRHMDGINRQGDIVWSIPGTGETETIHLTELAEHWNRNYTQGDKPEFPVKPLVLAWLDRTNYVRIDTRKTTIIPRHTGVTDYGQLLVELDQIMPPPRLGFIPSPYNQASAHLPGLDPFDETSLISPTLLMYNAAHMPPEKGGHGAPLSMRIWNEAVTPIPTLERYETGRITIIARELGRWPWPYSDFKRTRHLPTLNRALRDVNHATLRWKHGHWSAVVTRNFPEPPDDPVIMDVSLPPGSGPGPLIHRGVLRHYGVSQAALYRAYMCLAHIWDQYGTQKGRPIQSTRPSVLRDDEGYLLDADR